MTYNFPRYKWGKIEKHASVGLGRDSEFINIEGDGFHDGISVGATWWKGNGFKNKKMTHRQQSKQTTRREHSRKLYSVYDYEKLELCVKGGNMALVSHQKKSCIWLVTYPKSFLRLCLAIWR